MARYIARRLFMAIPVLLGVSFLVFLIAEFVPGDPVRLMLWFAATPERIARLRAELHLDDPFLLRYGRFIWNVLHGDLGFTVRGHVPVLGEILARLPSTFKLTASSMAFAAVFGISMGVIAARNRGKAVEWIAMVSALVGISIPSFWAAILLIIVFAVRLKWFPVVSSGDGLKDLILPTFVLALGPAAVLARLTRSCMIEVLEEDYVRTARGKGLNEKTVMYRHILRNAFIPLITYVGMLFAELLGGTVFIESVFARPGLGRLAVTAISARDFPMVQGLVLFIAAFYVLLNLIVDILYTVIDPRIRLR